MIQNKHVQFLIVHVACTLLIVCSSVFCSVGVLAIQLCSVYGPNGVFTIIDHVYASPTLNIEINVHDCNDSDHDSVLCCIHNKLVTTTANNA